MESAPVQGVLHLRYRSRRPQVVQGPQHIIWQLVFVKSLSKRRKLRRVFPFFLLLSTRVLSLIALQKPAHTRSILCCPSFAWNLYLVFTFSSFCWSFVYTLQLFDIHSSLVVSTRQQHKIYREQQQQQYQQKFNYSNKLCATILLQKIQFALLLCWHVCFSLFSCRMHALVDNLAHQPHRRLNITRTQLLQAATTIGLVALLLIFTCSGAPFYILDA